MTDEQIKKLLGKRAKGGLKGAFIGAKKQQAARLMKAEKLITQGISEIGTLTSRDFFVSGIMLYAAEGTKNDGEIGFANSDPYMIKFMVEWFRNVCKVCDKDLKGKLYIHENLDEQEGKQFWSTLTKIPISQFHKSYIAENRNGLKKNKHKYGVFTIRVCNRDLARKIKGWVQGILLQPDIAHCN